LVTSPLDAVPSMDMLVDWPIASLPPPSHLAVCAEASAEPKAVTAAMAPSARNRVEACMMVSLRIVGLAPEATCSSVDLRSL
jgi:hypothetical protein